MADKDQARIASALDGYELRKIEQATTDTEAKDRDRRAREDIAGRWIDLREVIARPPLMDAKQQVAAAGHDVGLLNDDTNGGLQLKVTPSGQQYTWTLSVGPELSAGTILVTASHGSVGTKGIPPVSMAM